MVQVWDLLLQFWDILVHLDQYLNAWMSMLGPTMYLLVFVIVFAETGLVIFPFLPGDSLLFALGALTAVEGAYLQLPLLLVTLITAAILGDAVNFAIGRRVGPKIFRYEQGVWLNRQHLLRAHAFYERHGGKTIILARFAPILRTFAPFVAGIARMHYPSFALYNVLGAFVWVFSFTLAGHFFGNLPQVKSHFHVVIVAIVVVSLLPIVVEYLKARRERFARASEGEASS